MQTISNCQTFIDNNLIIDDNNNKKVWSNNSTENIFSTIAETFRYFLDFSFWH